MTIHNLILGNFKLIHLNKYICFVSASAVPDRFWPKNPAVCSCSCYKLCAFILCPWSSYRSGKDVIKAELKTDLKFKYSTAELHKAMGLVFSSCWMFPWTAQGQNPIKPKLTSRCVQTQGLVKACQGEWGWSRNKQSQRLSVQMFLNVETVQPGCISLISE